MTERIARRLAVLTAFISTACDRPTNRPINQPSGAILRSFQFLINGRFVDILLYPDNYRQHATQPYHLETYYTVLVCLYPVDTVDPTTVRPFGGACEWVSRTYYHRGSANRCYRRWMADLDRAAVDGRLPDLTFWKGAERTEHYANHYLP